MGLHWNGTPGSVCSFIITFVDLFYYLFGFSRPYLWHAGSSVWCVGSGSLTRDWNWDPLQWKHLVPATEPPGKSLFFLLLGKNGTLERMVWCNCAGVMRTWNISPTFHKQYFTCAIWELKVHPGMSYFTDQKEHMCSPPGAISSLLNLKGKTIERFILKVERFWHHLIREEHEGPI